jgi:hypothetical protein
MASGGPGKPVSGKPEDGHPVNDKSGIYKQETLLTTETVTIDKQTNETKREEKPERAAKPRDPRLDHPALKAVIEVKGSYPQKETWDLVIKVVGDVPDIGRMRHCWVAWRARDFKPMNLGWLIDWYVNGIPERQKGNGPQRETASQRNVRNIRESLADLDRDTFVFKPRSKIC